MNTTKSSYAIFFFLYAALACSTKDETITPQPPSVSDVWTQQNNFEGDARVQAMSFTINNKCYVVGGVKGSSADVNSFYRDVWEYNVSKDKWTKQSDFSGTARFGSTTF